MWHDEAETARGDVASLCRGRSRRASWRGSHRRRGNRTLELKDPTAHAELLAIREAAQKLGSERLTGCDLFVTLEPCAMCAAAISFARIRRLYFAAADQKMGAVEHGPRFFTQSTCHHAPEVYGGIGEDRGRMLLKEFFKNRR
jgi:tRNA(adenine34) deaminase